MVESAEIVAIDQILTLKNSIVYLSICSNYICCWFCVWWVCKVWFHLQILLAPCLSEWLFRTSNTFAHNSILTNCMICTQIHHFGNWNGCKFTERARERNKIAQFWSQNLLVVEKEDYLRSNPNPSTDLLTQDEVGESGAALSAFDLCGNFVAVATEAKPSRLISRLFGGFACIHTRRFSEPGTSCWLKEHRLLPPVCPSLGLLVPLIGRYNLPNFITYRKQIMTNNTQSFTPLIADLVFHWNCA